MAKRPAPLVGRAFYFILALIIATGVAAGFHPRLERYLLHSPLRCPSYSTCTRGLHGLGDPFRAPEALIGIGRVKLHRKVGVFGLVLGVAVAIIGFATAIVMARFRAQPGHADGVPFLVLTLNDMIEYSIFFALAIYWRKKPEFHRRLMFIATCTLTSAAVRRSANSAPDSGFTLVLTL